MFYCFLDVDDEASRSCFPSLPISWNIPATTRMTRSSKTIEKTIPKRKRWKKPPQRKAAPKKRNKKCDGEGQDGPYQVQGHAFVSYLLAISFCRTRLLFPLLLLQPFAVLGVSSVPLLPPLWDLYLFRSVAPWRDATNDGGDDEEGSGRRSVRILFFFRFVGAMGADRFSRPRPARRTTPEKPQKRNLVMFVLVRVHLGAFHWMRRTPLRGAVVSIHRVQRLSRALARMLVDAVVALHEDVRACVQLAECAAPMNSTSGVPLPRRVPPPASRCRPWQRWPSSFLLPTDEATEIQ